MFKQLVVATAMIMGAAVCQASQMPVTVLPAGTQVFVQVDQNISSSNAQPGDMVNGKLVSALIDNQKHVLVPKGTKAVLQVIRVVAGNYYDSPADLTLQIVSLNVNGKQPINLVSYPVNRQGSQGVANPGTQVATQGVMNTFAMLGGRIGLLGSMGTSFVMAHDSTPRSMDVGYRNGDVVTFVLSTNTFITQ